MMEAIRTLNSYGLEVVSGIILGLDSDTSETEVLLRNFIDRSQIPMLTINLLQALPKTALWDRLARDGRLEESGTRESNVRFKRPYEEVVGSWRRCIDYAYDPERLYSRFSHQLDATYSNRLAAPPRGRLTKSNLKRGQIEALFGVGFISYHLIEFSREALRGDQNASFYSARARETAAPS
jgi:hypothetical protein